jgi:triosephosphate isomerase
MMKTINLLFHLLITWTATNAFVLAPKSSRHVTILKSTTTKPKSVWYDVSSTSSSSSSQQSFQRTPIIAGNWKLNPSTLQEATNLLKLIAANFIHHRTATRDETTILPEVVIFPPFPYLTTAISLLEGTGIKVGAQNVGLESKGAFTGEVAASMIRSLGCDYVMLGHSERRSIYDETDSDINTKVNLCLKENLNVILCVGETEEEYENDLLRSVIDMQLKKGLMNIQPSSGDLDRIVIAYEPVWAIGTGKVATPDQAQMAHVAVRQTLSEIFGPNAARKVRIQYGGSVTPGSIDDLMAMPDVDGALVGGASLTADSFTRIVDGGVVPWSIISTTTFPMIPNIRPKELTATECVSTKNVLGESPVWSQRDQCLYWISAQEEEVWAWNLQDAPFRRLMGTIVGCVAILNNGNHVKENGTNDQKGSLIVAGEKAFVKIEMMSEGTRDFSTGGTILCNRPEQTEATRPNDGRVDRQGRLVIGMYNNYHRAGSSAGDNNAGLYRLNSKLELESLLDYKYRVSNCICFPKEGNIMYFCDTPTRKVYAFDYPKEEGGKLSNRRLVWTVPANLPGGPDGAQVDEDGFLWIALSGAGRVMRVDPSTGRLDIVVHLPVSSPTSCTFGGPDLDVLFITTRGPDGGGLYRVKMPYGIKGVAEPEFLVDVSVKEDEEIVKDI